MADEPTQLTPWRARAACPCGPLPAANLWAPHLDEPGGGEESAALQAPEDVFDDLAALGLHFDAVGARVRIDSESLPGLLGRESRATFSISLWTRDLIRLLGLLRAPAKWLRFDAGGYYIDDAHEIVQIDSIVATWDECDEGVELIVSDWGWRTAPDPRPGEQFLICLHRADIQRVEAIRRYWDAGIRPVRLAPRYLDAGITVEEAVLLQRRPEEWDDLTAMVTTLATLRNAPSGCGPDVD